MAKITVYFKDKVVQSGLFDSGIVHIGRDQTNDLVIDSLAVAPVHAVLSIHKDGNSIKQLTEDFPILVNGENIKESVLINNDTLTIGKHDIFFQCTSINETTTPKLQVNDREYNDVLSLNKEISNIIKIPEANFQVMAGINIGKLIPITNSIMRLGHSGSGVVVIEKRNKAYLISLLKNKGRITLNNQPLNEEKLKINHLDILVIDNTPLQFFQS
jgi:pSer/pThr/pTyr-binding forkhead associated (FHA) protein